VSDEFERLDRLLTKLVQVLDTPGDEDVAPAEAAWQKLDVMYQSMGADALGTLLRRQGMDRSSADEALAVLLSRSKLMR